MPPWVQLPPRYHFSREVIRLPACKSGVTKQNRKRRTGALPALPTISGLVAQSAEPPVVCGKAEGATPFGSANFRILPRDTGSRCVGPAFPMKQSPWCSPSTPGRTARGVAATCSAWNRGTAGAIPAALTNFKFAVVAEYMRRPPSKRNDAGGTPVGSAIARWCQSSTAAC